MRFVKTKHGEKGGILGFFLNVIEFAAEGEADGYRYAAFEITPDEIERVKPAACKYAASILDDILSEHGIPEEKIKEEVKKVASCIKDVHEVLDEYGIETDYYVPSTDEVAAEKVMAKALSMIPGAPRDPQASEEPGYGLPEYSLYWGPDARSYTGRWYWSRGASEDVCWGLIAEEDVCDRINDILERLERSARRRGRDLLFAVWRKD